MNSNVRLAHVINVIMVESVIGKGIESDPVRALIEYFDLEGERLAQRDSWAEDTKEKNTAPLPEAAEVLHLSWPLTHYLYGLSQKGDIDFFANESIFDTALRLLKTQRERLEKYEPAIRLMEESKAWNLESTWVLYVEPEPRPCYRCSKEGTRNAAKLCFSCWEKLWDARHLMEETIKP